MGLSAARVDVVTREIEREREGEREREREMDFPLDPPPDVQTSSLSWLTRFINVPINDTQTDVILYHICHLT